MGMAKAKRGRQGRMKMSLKGNEATTTKCNTHPANINNKKKSFFLLLASPLISSLSQFLFSLFQLKIMEVK